jgi:DNA-binding MarR family transcriptional regulator
MTTTQDGQQDQRGAATLGLLDALGRLVRTGRAVGHRHQAEHGLGGTPLGILATLAVAEARAGDLAARLQVAPSVVSRALVPLEEAGLVERMVDPDDARATRLRLTAAGRAHLAEARHELAGRLSPLLEDWDTDDVRTLARLMGRLETTLAGAGPRATS